MRRALFLPTLLVLVLVGCGEEAGAPRQEPRANAAGLVFQRADGSTIEMPGRPLVWCGPWNDLIPNEALQVAAVGGVEPRAGQEWFSYWQLWAIPEDVEGRAAVTFPGDYTFDRPSGVVLFVGDSDTENEASTAGADSSGQIVFSEAGCEAGASVQFTIDAVADSEFGDGEPVTVKGTFRGVVGNPPADYGG